MKTPSILFVIDGIEFGGGERVFLQLASGLKSRFKVSVAAAAGGEFANRVKELGISYFAVDMSNQLSVRPIFQIASIIRKEKVSLVHSQGARSDFYARMATRLTACARNVCTVAMPVEGFDVKPLRMVVYRTLDWLGERYVDRFIVVSDALRRALTKRRGIDEHSVARIYNGIELEQYHPDAGDEIIRKEWGISQKAPIIGAIGRMVWQKGFEYLIRALPEVVQTVADAKFVLVGDGPLRGKLEGLSEELRVKDNVVFAGFRSDIKDVLSTIDLLAVPSLLEGLPMVTLEAMAMAKPIVASYIDGIDEQIDSGVHGILVPPRDPIALADAIIEVLSDREYAKCLGVAARERVESEFSVDRMIAETEEVYSSLMET